jgi:FkbM family methyltransferase
MNAMGGKHRSLWRELAWRLRRIGPRDVARLLSVVHPSDWKKALRLFPSDGVAAGGETSLRLRGVPDAVVVRNGSSDLEVFWQIFVDEQYAVPWRLDGPTRCILDCGANVGFSALYLLNRYPDSHVIAVEPDPANLAAARRNLAGYQHRCTLLAGAVWDSDGTVLLSRGTFGDGREWATEVVPATGAGDTVRAFTIPSLLREAGFSRADVIKMDVEGAELRVMAADVNRGALSQAQLVAMELHGDAHRQAFLELATKGQWRLAERGEVTFGAPQSTSSSTDMTARVAASR